MSILNAKMIEDDCIFVVRVLAYSDVEEQLVGKEHGIVR